MTVLTVATVQLLVLLPALAALAGLLLRRRRGVSGLVAVGAAALALRAVGVPVRRRPPAARRSSRRSVPPGGRAADPPEPARRPHLGRHRRRRRHRRAGRPGVLGLVPARRPPLPPSSRPPSRSSSPPCCSSSSRTTSCSRWSAGRSWAGAPTCSSATSARRESARRAAYKAFIVTRVADIGFVVGLVILAVGAGSTEIGTVMAHWTGRGVGDGRTRHGQPGAHRRAGPAPRRRGGQVGPHPVPRLAPRRHGGPDARVGAHPRGDDGGRRHLRRRPAPPAVRRRRHRSHRPRRAGRADDGLGRSARLRPDRHQADAGVLHAQPDRRHGQRARVQPRAERDAGARPRAPLLPRPLQVAALPRGRLAVGARRRYRVRRPAWPGPGEGRAVLVPRRRSGLPRRACRRWSGSSPRRASSSPPRSR